MSTFGRGRGRGGKGNTKGRHESTCEVTSNLRLSIPQTPQLALEEPQVQTNVVLTQHPTAEEQHDSPRTHDSSAASCSTLKKRRGSYRSIEVDMMTKHGGKITVEVPEHMARVVGPNARQFANYCGFVLRTTISFTDGSWDNIVGIYGDAMFLKVKEKFQSSDSRRELTLKGAALLIMQNVFRSWKTKLHQHYLHYASDEERLANIPAGVSPADWKWLVDHFGGPEFKKTSERNKKNRAKQTTKHTCGPKSFVEIEASTRDPNTGELAPPDRVWELQHIRKTKEGEVVWADQQSKEIYDRLHELVVQQDSQPSENQLTRDEILTTVLGEWTGYVRGKGYGVKPPPRRGISQLEIDARVSSALQAERVEWERKLEEERAQRLEMERRMEEQRLEMEQRMQQQLAAIMSSIQQGQFNPPNVITRADDSTQYRR